MLEILVADMKLDFEFVAIKAARLYFWSNLALPSV